jgi:hypothetical protein
MMTCRNNKQYCVTSLYDELLDNDTAFAITEVLMFISAVGLVIGLAGALVCAVIRTQRRSD